MMSRKNRVRVNPPRVSGVILARDARGVTAIEFALIAPVLTILTMAIIEFAMIMFAHAVIDNAANATARLGITGNSYGAASRQEALTNEILANSMGMLDRSRLSVRLSLYDMSTGVNMAFVNLASPTTSIVDLTNGTGNFGVGGQPVLYTVEYRWKLITPLAPLLMTFLHSADPSTIVLRASALARNERF
jgi:Flp pilus assembly protein TadG